MNDWSMLRKLIWLHVISGGGSSGARTTVTGVSPLALANALAKPIRSLIQYGKVTTSNGEMYCNNGKLVAVDDELSVVGTPEVLTVGEQTATVENLLAVDNIADEQNIISGTVTRRCEAVISDGTTPSGRYIGEVGDGNIIVKVRETGYEGDVATFEADRAEPLNGLSVNVEPIQAGSGDPSPENVRPISGRTSATVTRTGRNLFDKNAATVGKFINASGQEIVNSSKSHSELIPVKPSTAYFMNGFGNSGYFAILAVDANKQPITWYGGASKDAPFTATMPSNCRYVYLNFNTDQIDTMAFYEGNTNEGYIPYQGNTYTIQLGDTVYGGTLDVTGGKMVVDRAMVDLGTLNWQYDSVADFKNFWAYGFTVIAPPPNNGKKANILCSNYKTITANEGYLGTELVGIAVAINQRLFVYDPNYSDASVFKTAMSGVQLCYELATPLEITLTPTQIDTLLGTNNIWSDAGSVKVYVADGDLVEHVTAQPLRTAEGSNTVSVTSAVAPVQLSATYTASE